MIGRIAENIDRHLSIDLLLAELLTIAWRVAAMTLLRSPIHPRDAVANNLDDTAAGGR